MTYQLISQEIFEKDVRDSLEENLLSKIGSKFFSTDPYSIEFLIRRYLDLFNPENFKESNDNNGSNMYIPSKAIILDYLADEEFTKKKVRPDKGAFSCEFWGGVFYENVENSRKSQITLEDFAQKLSMCYAMLATQTQIYSFASSSEVADQILLSFRLTSRDLGIPVNQNIDPKVIKLVR